jgi:Tfp pilus assembly protein PilX
MKAADEKGVALIMVLILMGILSVLAASLVFVSQSETWSSQNYRLMTEARYGAEAGVHKAANFLINNYPAPASMSGYDITQSPVHSGGADVTLTSDGSSSHYPDSSVQTAYTAFVHGQLTSSTDPVTYDATATLVSMRQVDVYGSALPVTVQTWKIVGQGTIGGARPATVKVEAIIEREVQPMFAYAAFATASGCGALTWYGNSSTDSYDSMALAGGNPVITSSGGNVGTNGNLNIYGNANINGTLSTPRSGVGACSAGAVTAISGSVSATDGLVELPQPVNYPPPTPPATLSPTSVSFNNGSQALDPGNYGDLDFKGTLELTSGTYNINSIYMSGQGSIHCTIVAGVPVIINVAGYAHAGTYEAVPSNPNPITLQGGATINVDSYNPSLFQVTYAGSQTVSMQGNSGFVGVLYAPNATWSNGGTPDWYGAVIAKNVTDFGSARIHYDRRLSTAGLVVGPWMIDSFSWRKF